MLIDRETSPLSVGTFNIRGWSEQEHDGINAWSNRAPLTLQVIESVHPDGLGFQEFSGRLNSDFYRNALGMQGMDIHLGPKMDEDRYNPIAFNAQRLRINSSDVIWLSESGEPEPSWGADETRSAVYVIFEEQEKRKDTGTEIVFVNTHLDHKNELARVEGTKRILQRLSRIDDRPIVIVGDFNSSYYSPHDHPDYTSVPYDLFKAADFQDAFVAANPDKVDDPPHTFHNYEGEMYKADQYGTWHTDWILYKGFDLCSYQSVRDFRPQPPHFASDHYLETADLTRHKD